MDEKKVVEIATYLLENGVKSQDIYFEWRRIFNMVAEIECARAGVPVSGMGRVV